MTRFDRNAAAVPLTFLAALSLVSCSGGSSTPPGPAAPTASPARQTSLSNAARGTLTVVLSALATARFYGTLVRPGVGAALGALPATPAPSCNAATHSAATAFPNQTGTATVVTTAFYPANDPACSQSPLRVLVMQYALGASAQSGFGYQILYSGANDPVFGGPGIAVAADAVLATVYKATDGSASIVANIDPGAASVGSSSNGPPAPPPPGTFPATFPSTLPPPQSILPFSLYFATAETGASSTTNVANTAGAFPAPPGFINGSFSGYVASSDDLAVHAGPPDASGNVTLSLVDGKPLFATDITNGGIRPTVSPAYPFPAGATPLTIGPLSSLGYRSTAANLPKPVTGTATYDASGTLVACSETATDPLDGVQVQATCANGGATISVSVTDLFAKASAIVPATIVLDAYGISVAPVVFKIDASAASVSEFVLQ